MTAPRELTLVRTFDATPALVFSMWTDARHFARWSSPRGFSLPECAVDPRPGGRVRYRMVGMGYDHIVDGEFLELDPPRRLVLTLRVTFDAESQVENRTTVTFEAVDGITRMTLHVVITHATGPMVEEALGGMSQGWNETLDKLMELVARQAA